MCQYIRIKVLRTTQTRRAHCCAVATYFSISFIIKCGPLSLPQGRRVTAPPNPLHQKPIVGSIKMVSPAAQQRPAVVCVHPSSSAHDALRCCWFYLILFWRVLFVLCIVRILVLYMPCKTCSPPFATFANLMRHTRRRALAVLGGKNAMQPTGAEVRLNAPARRTCVQSP